RGFAEDLHIPVAHTFMGKGAMPWTSPMNLLTVGVLPRDYELAGLDESDLVIAIGFDFVEYDPRSWNPRGDRRIVHIDSLPAEISVHYVPEVEVVGEIRTSLHVLSAMGIALPGGIAAKLADPDRRVMTLSGDGGFLMSVHELETAKRERTATVNLVFRDGGLGSIRWKQMAKFGRMTGTGFDNPDFVRLAEAFGIRGFRVEHPSELSSVLSEALQEASPTVVDVPVDYSDNPFIRRGT